MARTFAPRTFAARTFKSRTWAGAGVAPPPVIDQPAYWFAKKPAEKPPQKVKVKPVEKPEKTIPLRRYLEAAAGELELYGYPANFVVSRLLRAEAGSLSLGGHEISGQVELAGEDFDFDGEAIVVTQGGKTTAFVGVVE